MPALSVLQPDVSFPQLFKASEATAHFLMCGYVDVQARMSMCIWGTDTDVRSLLPTFYIEALTTTQTLPNSASPTGQGSCVSVSGELGLQAIFHALLTLTWIGEFQFSWWLRDYLSHLPNSDHLFLKTNTYLMSSYHINHKMQKEPTVHTSSLASPTPEHWPGARCRRRTCPSASLGCVMQLVE